MRRHEARNRILLDGVEVGPNGKGIERVLTSVIPRLVALRPEVYVVATTAAGLPLLDVPRATVRIVREMPDTVWEQIGLPAIARRLGAEAIYTHREAGPLWGAPCLLHVPEDPEIRWARTPPRSNKERLRRGYSRRLMRPSLRRAHVSTSTTAVWLDLTHRKLVSGAAHITPLGIDHNLFRPQPGAKSPTLFHLGSADDRDNLPAVLAAFEAVAALDASAQLQIAGSIGPEQSHLVHAWAQRTGLTLRTHLLGRIPDEELVTAFARCTVAVQPSFDEGFGLQALEALGCGAALVVAPGSSVEEVVGDAAVVARSGSSDDVAHAVATLWRDAHRLETLRSRGSALGALHTWDAAARRIDDLLIRLVAH